MTATRLLLATSLCLTVLALQILSQNVEIPTFKFDPSWPKPLPENWSIGPVVGVSVDSRDHVWIVHRRTALIKNDRYTAATDNPPRAECCIP
ncbi:uncharacterized protein METZ01_LOCUS510199, partial [marine metagenome]